MNRYTLLGGSIFAASLIILASTMAIAAAVNSQVISPASAAPHGASHFTIGFPSQGLYCVHPLCFKESMYTLLRDWGAKPFPNTTAMFVGGGIGFLPFLNLSIVLVGVSPDIPDKVEVYSDGHYYGTLYPLFWGPISARFYHLWYHEKGFHSLTFVAENFTSLRLDIQIGFHGFVHHIIPYVMKQTNEREV